jgi:hypothetical protein
MTIYCSVSTSKALYQSLMFHCEATITTFLSLYTEATHTAMCDDIDAWITSPAPSAVVNATTPLSELSVLIMDTDGNAVYITGRPNAFNNIAQFANKEPIIFNNFGSQFHSFISLTNESGEFYMTKISPLTTHQGIYYAVRQGTKSAPLGVVNLRFENPFSII